MATLGAAPDQAGKWSPSQDWNGIGVHLILAPVDKGDYHSQIMWWRGKNNVGLLGGLRLWKPATELPESTWTQNFADTSLAYPGSDIFCSGHCQTSTGAIVVAGGTQVGYGETGTDQVRQYDPVTHTWTASTPSSMNERRWYPTATTLSDGRAVVMSGSSYVQQHIVGGVEQGGTPTNKFQRFKVLSGGGWEPVLSPAPGDSAWPSPRSGHSVAFGYYSSVEAYFGGDSLNRKFFNDVRVLYRNANSLHAGDYEYV